MALGETFNWLCTAHTWGSNEVQQDEVWRVSCARVSHARLVAIGGGSQFGAELNGLTKAQETGGTNEWSQTFDYDNVGNRWVDSSASTLIGFTPLFTPTQPTNFDNNNRLVLNSSQPDSAGNLKQIGGYHFGYDGENRITSSALNVVTAYVYDGNGQRVQKVVCPAGTSPCTAASTGATVTTYVYDAFGNLAAEYGPSSSSICGTLTCYLTSDQLGSVRLMTDSSGNAKRRYDYLPFGEEIFATTGGRTTAMGYQSAADGFNLKFTGAEREDVTTQGQDFLQARYFSGTQGRFTSADPANAGADPLDPQTWNMYSYVTNNPLTYTDRTGLGFWSGLGDLLGAFLGIYGDYGGLGVPAGLPGGGEQVWNEQPPVFGGTSSAVPLNTGTVWGSGDAGPWVNNWEDAPFHVALGGPTGFWFGQQWLWGILPDLILYGANDPGTRDMKRTRIVQQMRREYMALGCPTYQYIDSGHLGPAVESARNLIFGNATQFQVGGFNGAITTSGDGAMTTYAIRNTAGWSSLLGESTWGAKIGLAGNALDTHRGPGSNVQQVFSWSEPNPCHQ